MAWLMCFPLAGGALFGKLAPKCGRLDSQFSIEGVLPASSDLLHTDEI